MKNIFKIPMQFFAEDGTEPAGAAASADGAQNPEPVPQGDGQQKTDPAAASDKTFTQADVDRIVAERLERQQKKFTAEKEEAAKLAKMNAEEKANYAAQKREEELAAREKAIQEKELRYTALNILEENKLPTQLVDCLNLTSAETCNKSIESIKKAWTEALTAAVDARLKTSAPPVYSGGNKESDPFLEAFGS